MIQVRRRQFLIAAGALLAAPHAGAKHARSVKDFGAKGNGAKDDTAAIQAAMTALKIAGGGTLFFPAGTYNVSANLGLTGATGVRIAGAAIGAVIIHDTRADVAPYGPTGAYYGLMSFVNSTFCGVEDLTLKGSWNGIAGALTPNQSRKATLFRNCQNSYVRHISTSNFRDEGIYADINAHGWEVSDCITETTNANAINLNDYAVARGVRIVNNSISGPLHGGGIVAGARSITVSGNVITFSNLRVAPVGYDPILIDAAAGAIVTNNIIFDTDTSNAGVSGIIVYGRTAPATSFLLISDNIIVNVLSDYERGNGAAITLNKVGGTSVIQGNMIDNCGRFSTADGRGIVIAGASTGKVFVKDNVIRNRAGRNINIGVKVDGDVPEGAVQFGVNYFDNVATPYVP